MSTLVITVKYEEVFDGDRSFIKHHRTVKKNENPISTRLRHRIRSLTSRHLDLNLSFREQDPEKVSELFDEIQAEARRIEGHEVDSDRVKAIIKGYLTHLRYK